MRRVQHYTSNQPKYVDDKFTHTDKKSVNTFFGLDDDVSLDDDSAERAREFSNTIRKNQVSVISFFPDFSSSFVYKKRSKDYELRRASRWLSKWFDEEGENVSRVNRSYTKIIREYIRDNFIAILPKFNAFASCRLDVGILEPNEQHHSYITRDLKYSVLLYKLFKNGYDPLHLIRNPSYRSRIQKRMGEEIAKAVFRAINTRSKGIRMKSVIMRIGREVVQDVKEFILSGRKPALASETIRKRKFLKKKHSQAYPSGIRMPLAETGSLANDISCAIYGDFDDGLSSALEAVDRGERKFVKEFEKDYRTREAIRTARRLHKYRLGSFDDARTISKTSTLLSSQKEFRELTGSEIKTVVGSCVKAKMSKQQIKKALTDTVKKKRKRSDSDAANKMAKQISEASKDKFKKLSKSELEAAIQRGTIIKYQRKMDEYLRFANNLLNSDASLKMLGFKKGEIKSVYQLTPKEIQKRLDSAYFDLHEGFRDRLENVLLGADEAYEWWIENNGKIEE